MSPTYKDGLIVFCFYLQSLYRKSISKSFFNIRFLFLASIIDMLLCVQVSNKIFFYLGAYHEEPCGKFSQWQELVDTLFMTVSKSKLMAFTTLTRKSSSNSLRWRVFVRFFVCFVLPFWSFHFFDMDHLKIFYWICYWILCNKCYVLFSWPQDVRYNFNQGSAHTPALKVISLNHWQPLYAFTDQKAELSKRPGSPESSRDSSLSPEPLRHTCVSGFPAMLSCLLNLWY